MTKPKLEGLTTESPHPRTADLDRMTAREILALMNDEEARVAAAVRRALPAVERLVEELVLRMERGGRLIYCGAGTSGRLGVLDAAECVPTFRSREGQVVGLIAGGAEALLRAVEGAEDSEERGAADLRAIDARRDDTVVGIATSGRTPYVLGALGEARARGCLTAALVCNEGSPAARLAEIAIEAVVGPEILSGSTRLKAGTATKQILNMISTAAFVRLGKVYGNRMVDLLATNSKLLDRATRIVREICGVGDARAAEALDRCGREVKTAIVWISKGGTPEQARERLESCGGRLREALELP